MSQPTGGLRAHTHPRVSGRRTSGEELFAPTKVLLLLFAALTAAAVAALLVGAGRTEDAFAWTIRPPLAAAFLGAAYASGLLVTLLTLRAGVWEQARWALLTILVFTVLTLGATLLHLDRLHFDRDEWLPATAAWFWLAVYVVVPPGLLAVIWLQSRAARGTSPRTRSRPPWLFQRVLLAQGVVLVAAGAALLVPFEPLVEAWPWALTPLVARVTGAWLVAFALGTVLAARADYGLLRPAATSYAAFGALQLVVAGLYRADLRGGPATAAYLGLGAVVAATGWWGAWRAGPA